MRRTRLTMPRTQQAYNRVGREVVLRYRGAGSINKHLTGTPGP